MGIFHDLFCQSNIIFEGVLGSINHDRGKSAVNTGFARFEIGAMVKVKCDREVVVFQGCFNEMFQIARLGVFSGTGRSLKNNRGLKVRSCVGNSLDDFHIIDVESPDGIMAGIGFFEHFGSCD